MMGGYRFTRAGWSASGAPVSSPTPTRPGLGRVIGMASWGPHGRSRRWPTSAHRELGSGRIARARGEARIHITDRWWRSRGVKAASVYTRWDTALRPERRALRDEPVEAAGGARSAGLNALETGCQHNPEDSPPLTLEYSSYPGSSRRYQLPRRRRKGFPPTIENGGFTPYAGLGLR